MEFLELPGRSSLTDKPGKPWNLLGEGGEVGALLKQTLRVGQSWAESRKEKIHCLGVQVKSHNCKHL